MGSSVLYKHQVAGYEVMKHKHHTSKAILTWCFCSNFFTKN